MDKATFKYESSKDSVQNGATDTCIGSKRSVTTNTQNCAESKNSVKKKDLRSMSYRWPSTEKSDSFDGKYKEKKKKSDIHVDEAVHVTSDSPKYVKTPKNVCEMNLESDLMAKINSTDNMRKSVKQNRQPSVPNDFSELKGHQNVSQKNSPLPAKGASKSPITNSKYRSKTPDSKGATGYTPGKRGNPAKKGINFEPYIPLFQVQQGLKRGEFIEGAIRINPRNYEDAYISAPDGKMDIYIGGMQNRNRAFNGDIVVVQINPKQEWKVLCDAIKDYQEKSGKSFVDTICEPISPAIPCKVHTPDPFVKPRPFSSNSWDGTRGQRSPDTLEILGIDKIAKQFENISVKQKTSSKSKTKRKIKNTKHATENSSQKSSNASYSQESSEDCLDKISPGQCSDKDDKDGSALHMVVSENNETIILTEETVSGMHSENILLEHTYPPCDMKDIGEFCIETEINENENKWINSKDSVNIIISPDELLQIDGNSLLNTNDFHEQIPVNEDSCSDVDGIIVPPGDLTGDEFTDSASVDSSYSDHMEKVLENSDFLTCQQDAQNNNIDSISQNVERVTNRANYNSVITLQTASISTENSIDAHCKIQFNKSVLPIAVFDGNSEVVCSTLTEVFPQNSINSIEENIILQCITPGDSLHATNAIDNNQLNQGTNPKKPRQRKKKKKSTSSKNKSISNRINELVKTFNDLHSLTVDQVMEHPDWPRFIQKTGKVVHILERKHSCIAAGHLKLLPDKNVKWALFSPNDNRVPRILVPMSDCPQNFYNRSYDFANVLFLAEIIQWEDHCTYASGRLIKELGNTGDIEVETEGILIENSVDFQEFNEDVLACVPQDEEWVIPFEELKYRRDLRNQCVFTIDPSTARDMDDAVSCNLLENGNYEIGVHIADVTYFVLEGTDLDNAAKERSTSVYLVQKVVPMLPRKLCDELCSLNPGKDRLTFSVIWEMSPEGAIFHQWIGRSVINSCIKLSYEHAQDMIENPHRTWTDFEHPLIYGNFTINDIIKRVNELHFLAVNLRDKRFMEGALRLDQVKLQFTLNTETGLPSGFNVFVQKDSNKLIEEFMLLANMSVAEKIYTAFPSLSLLRRHPPPQTKLMQDVVTMCESMGIILDTTNSGTLQTSIAHYKGDDYRSYAMIQALMNLCSKPMNCALYFCTGVLEEIGLYRHYALNVPLYTHFTSPIRRYPDIIVHRLLGAALNYNPVPNMNPIEMKKCASHCNDKKYNAKRVSELSSEMFLAAFICSLGSVCAKAMVITVMDHSFDCLIMDMGIIKRVYCDKLPLVKKEYKRSHGLSVLNLTWKDDSIKEGIKQTIVMFTLVDVVLVVENETLQIKVMLTKPTE